MPIIPPYRPAPVPAAYGTPNDPAAPPVLDGPLEKPPFGLPGALPGAALHDALAGVPLGAYDRRIIAWLAGWDEAVVLTVASLIRRARRMAARGTATPA